MTILSFYQLNAQVGIGTTQVEESAILELNSKNKGFLPPRLTTEQRNAISSPQIGLFIYNTTYSCLQYYTSGGWYDPCCKNTVDNGISGFSFLTQIDPTQADVFTKINSVNGTSAGVTAVNGEYVFAAASSAGDPISLTYTPGTVESGVSHEVFKYTTSTHPIDYKSTSYISRDRTADHGAGEASTLLYDFVGGDEISNASFDVFLVGRMDSNFTPFPGNASFFSTSTSSSQNATFQLGVGNTDNNDQGVLCNRDYYNIRYSTPTGTTKVLCGYTDGNRTLAADGRLHIFNIKCQEDSGPGTNKIFSLYIDGILADSDSTITDYMAIDKLKLFANRQGGSGVQSDISELSIFSPALSNSEQETMNQYLLCKYGD